MKIATALESLAVPVGAVIPDPANARTGHDIEGIKNSLLAYGQRTPIVVNKRTGIVLKGNGTLTAARSLGAEKIAAVFVDDDPVTATSYAIADNRIGDKSHFDDAALKRLLDSVEAPLDIPGIDAEFLAMLDRVGSGFGGESDTEAGFPELADGDRQPFQQKTFTLHDEQAQIVDDAVTLARTNPIVDTGINDNSNGNALALICQQWLESKNGDR